MINLHQGGQNYTHLSVSLIFALNGLAFSNWFTRIPDTQQRLGLNTAQLGFVLLGMPLGSILIMPLTSWLLSRYGSSRTTFWSTLFCCLVIILPTLSWSFTSLGVALLLLGFGNGSMDVAMNAMVADVEQSQKVPIMSTCHAFFSLGGFIGAAIGSLFVGLNISPPQHLLCVSLFLVILLMVIKNALPKFTASRQTEPLLALPSKALIGLAVVAFCIELGEGAISDWSAVYLRNTLNAAPILVGAGFASFSLNMTVGRFYGDSLSSKWGTSELIRRGAIFAAIGLTLGLWTANAFGAIIGFGCVGLGYAAIIPLLFRAAALVPGMTPGSSIASVASAGYFGFLIGPIAIGSVSQLVGLGWGLWLVAILAFATFYLSPYLNLSD